VRKVAVLLLALAACTTGTRRDGTPPSSEWQTPSREVLRGKAVWYGGKWHGRATASGERFNKRAMTAAHRKLPLGTRVRVTNLMNGKSVDLRINDRGPYGRDRSRIIDVSEAAADVLGFRKRGWTRVTIEVLESPRRARDAPDRKRRK
jgi:rare lipoprotein A